MVVSKRFEVLNSFQQRIPVLVYTEDYICAKMLITGTQLLVSSIEIDYSLPAQELDKLQLSVGDQCKI